jgi:16S rRNA (uracil1498-N3)-methyltransferase
LRAEAAPAFVYVPDLPEPGASGWIEGEDRHHLVNVCRAAPGERATATDGRGRRAAIRIGSVGRRVAFEVESVEILPQGAAALIACGAPDGARADWLIEKLAEFGIAEFQPLDTARGRWRWSAARAARFERLALAALKQSRRVHRLRAADPIALPDWLRAHDARGTRWVADASGGYVPSAPAPGRFTAVAGPAAGFTGAEREALLGAGFAPVRLGAGTLRAETAGLALAALWAGLGQDRGT